MQGRVYIPIFILLAGLAGTITVYWPGLDGPFLLDDNSSVLPATLRNLEPAELYRIVTSNGSGSLGRPISVASFALTNYFHGVIASAHKYDNLMLHLLTGCLLFWLGGRLLIQLLGKGNENTAWQIASVAAILWLLHPLLVSTVLYAVQRMTQLSALFTVACLLSYTCGRQALDTSPGKGAGIIIAGFLVFAPLALFSKENGALIPLYILVIELFIFRFKTSTQPAKYSLYTLFTLLVVTPLVAGLLYFLTHLNLFLAGYQFRDFTATERLITETRVLWLYIGLIITPLLSKMSLFHDDFPISHGFDPVSTAAAAGIIGLLILGIVARKKAPLLGFCIAWFFMSHVLESTIINLELVFEHRNYLAAYGPLLAIAYYSMTAKTKAGSHRPGYTLVMAIIALLAVLTSIRATTWGSYELLIRVTADYHPTSTRALINTANIYIHRNEFDRAHKVLDQMEDIYPDKSYSYMLRVHLMCFENKVTSESVEKAAKSIARGEVESYTIQALQDTINMYHLGRCTTINADQLLTLTNAVLGNDRIDNKKKYYIGLHQAKLLIQIRRFSEAIATIRNIMPYASSAPFAYRHEVFYFLAIAEIYSNQFDEAMASINKLKSVNNNSLINIDDKIRQLEQLYTEQSDRLREELINS